ncbi:MAG TPA: hypothetical protein VGN20_02950 [Mucilaginibacter sp.]
MKSLLTTQSHAELVSAPHGTSGLLGVRLVYWLAWRILCMWGAETSSARHSFNFKTSLA